MSSITLSGDVRRLPPSWGLRLLQALSLWLLVRACANSFARFVLGYRRRFELSSTGEQLVLQQSKSVWGQRIGSSESILPLSRLQEITLETQGENPHFTTGLVALGLGSLFGFRLLTEGSASSSVSVISLGLGLVVLGVLADFFLGSGRSVEDWHASPQLVIKLEGTRGWVLSRLEPKAAEAALQAIRQALQGAHPGEPVASQVPPAEGSTVTTTQPLSEESPSEAATEPPASPS